MHAEENPVQRREHRLPRQQGRGHHADRQTGTDALQGAVREAVETMDGKSRDEVYEFLFQKLQPQFVDFKPGPDLSACADAVANGDVQLDA